MMLGKGKGFAAAAALAAVAAGDSACTFTFPAAVASKAKGNGILQPPNCAGEGIDETCCATIQHAIDHFSFEKRGAALVQVDLACGRNDQVGLYNCIAKLPVATKGAGKAGVTIPTAVAIDSPEGTDECVTYLSASELKQFHDEFGVKLEPSFRYGTVSTGCCAELQKELSGGIKYRFDEKHAAKHAASKVVMQEQVDLFVGMLGKCGKADLKEIHKTQLKENEERKHPKGKGKGDGLQMLAATHATEVFQPTLQALMLPATESELSATLQAMFPSIELAPEKDDASSPESPTSTSLVTGMLGFIAGAATVGFGTFCHRRRSPALAAPLAEPMMA